MNTTSLFIAALCALIPAIIWMVLWYAKDKSPEPKSMIARAFFWGLIGTVPILGMKFQIERSPNLLAAWADFSAISFGMATLLLATGLAFLEEWIKHFSVLRLGSSLRVEFDQIVDGIIYSVAAALGFAFGENILFFFQTLTYSPADFWQVVAVRSISTTFGHTLFSGLFGLLWGHAFLSQSISPKHSFSVRYFFKNGFRRIGQTITFHITRRHIFSNRASTRGHEQADVVLEGLLLAGIFHTLFNLLSSSPMMKLIAPFLMGLFLFLSHQFFIPKNIKIMKPLS